MPTYLPPGKIRELYDVCNSTLRSWAKDGKITAIRIPGGKQKHLSDIERYLGVKNPQRQHSVVYARVSSAKQKEDLRKQVEDLKRRYRNHKVVTDVASGLNFRRKGLQTILEQAIKGHLHEVVVLHRDRLCRLAFPLVESILEKAGTQLVVLGDADHSTPEEELAEDLLAVTTVFMAQSNGLRAAKNRKRRREEATGNEEEKNSKRVKQTARGQGQKVEDISQQMSKEDAEPMV